MKIGQHHHSENSPELNVDQIQYKDTTIFK